MKEPKSRHAWMRSVAGAAVAGGVVAALAFEVLAAAGTAAGVQLGRAVVIGIVGALAGGGLTLFEQSK